MRVDGHTVAENGARPHDGELADRNPGADRVGLHDGG
jgi:hypothetical protein